MDRIAIGTTYRIYGKGPGMARFMPFDGKGAFVGNLIYAAFYDVVDGTYAERLQALMDQLRQDNPEYTFELRRVKG